MLAGGLNKEEIRVSRPIKLRVHGLDDLIDNRVVAEAVSGAGGYSVTEVKVGVLRREPSGLRTDWLKCSAATAKTLADARRLKVGWVAARIEVLQPRPLKCHCCLKAGHTRQRCKVEVDRSGRCYRCSQTGHTAGGCSEKPNCPLCGPGLACYSQIWRTGFPPSQTERRKKRKRGNGKQNGDRQKPPKGGSVQPKKGAGKDGQARQSAAALSAPTSAEQYSAPAPEEAMKVVMV